MKKVEDYLRYAAECRDMAQTASAPRRLQLEQMAEAWERLGKAGQDQSDERGTGGPGLVSNLKYRRITAAIQSDPDAGVGCNAMRSGIELVDGLCP